MRRRVAADAQARARSAQSTIAVTDPLPLVPAMRMLLNVRLGMAERRGERLDVREAELDAELLEREQVLERASTVYGSATAALRFRLQPASTGCWPMNRSALRDGALHLAAIDDEVEHAVLEQELAALKAFGQLLANRLLDDARAGEADERARLGDVQIAEHREARRDAAGRRIGQDRDVGNAAPDRGARAPSRFSPSASATSAPSIMRAPPEHETMIIGRRVASARSMPLVIFSPTTTPMLPPMKPYSIAATIGFVAVDAAAGDDDRVFHAGGLDAGFQRACVGLRVGEPQRIGRDEPAVVFGPWAVEQRAQPIERAHAEVKAAFRADAQVLREILVVENLRAPGALDPQAFGHPAWLCVGRRRSALRAFLNQAISGDFTSTRCAGRSIACRAPLS